MRPHFLFIAPATLILSICDGDDNDPGPTAPAAPPAVSMQITAQNVRNTAGGECITFAALPSENVILASVRIENPLRNAQIFSLGGATVARNQPVPLQATGACWARFSGAYNFTFEGAPLGGGGNFTTTATYNAP